VPDSRNLRGPHPRDADGFSDEAIPILGRAVDELSWMLTKGYPKRGALKLVGDRYSLRERQRKAVQHCAASDQACAARRRPEVLQSALAGEGIVIDGYNVLLNLEAALSGGALLVGRDGALRDMAAMSKHYRRLHVTRPALRLVAEYCLSRGCREVVWYFDRPISNSGRLRSLIVELADRNSWPWQVHLVPDPDRTLAVSDDIVATSDSAILERCQRWFNLTRSIVDWRIPDAWIVNLAGRENTD